MRKGLFFWFSVLLAAGIIAGAVFFFGKVPEKMEMEPVMAIPAIDMDAPRVFLAAGAGQIEPVLPEKLIEEAEESARPVMEALNDLLPVLGLADGSYVLAAWDENEPVFYGVFLLPENLMTDISSGRIPPAWLELSRGLAMGPSERDGVLRLTAGRGRLVLFLRTERGMLLASHSPDGLDRMQEALEGKIDRFEVSLSVERSWPAHLVLFDGKLFAQAASLRGIAAPDSPVSAELAWNSNVENGEIAWRIEGLKEWLPERIKNRMEPRSWSEPVYLPDPLVLAAGISLPEGFEEVVQGEVSIPGWMEDAGIDRESIAELLEGPVIGTIGGQSRVFLFSLPGFLFQLPSRGDKGTRWIDALWSNKWASLAFMPKVVSGFTHGGKMTIPFTMIAAARDDLAIAGVMSDSSLGKPRRIQDVVPMGDGKALMWLYADFPKAAEVLEDLSKINNIADRLGVKGTHDPEEILAMIEELRSMGQITLVMHDIGSGRGSWKGASPVKK